MVGSKQIKACHANISRSSGFSLIEVAIALMVIGLILSSVLQAYNIQAQKEKENTTSNNIVVVQTALAKYLENYGRYPRPAHRNIAVGTAGFGVEAPVPPAVDKCGTAAVFNSGVSCRTEHTFKDINNNDTRLYYGDVPFATLGIHYKNVLDGYGGKLIYVITSRLTEPGNFRDNGGAIRVRALNSGSPPLFDTAKTYPMNAHVSYQPNAMSPIIKYKSKQNGNLNKQPNLNGAWWQIVGGAEEYDQYGNAINETHITEAAAAHYFVYSAGPGNHHAFNLWGKRIAPCRNGTDDDANCDTGSRFRSNYDNSLGNQSLRYVRFFADGPRFFDDISGYSTTSQGGIWAINASTGGLINTNSLSGTLIGAQSFLPPAGCTVNTEPCIIPPQARVDVKGNVRANEVRLRRICYSGDTACADPGAGPFPTGMLTTLHYATEPNTAGAYNNATKGHAGGGILCSGNRGLKGFGYQSGSTNHIDETCTDQISINNPATFAPANCAPGKYAIGISAGGVLLCSP